MSRARVYSSLTPFQAHFVAELLRSAGIPATVTNDNLTHLAGVVPVSDVMAEVWVPLECAEEAAEIVAETTARGGGELSCPDEHLGALSVPPEACPACGAEAEPGFEVCWQCGKPLA